VRRVSDNQSSTTAHCCILATGLGPKGGVALVAFDSKQTLLNTVFCIGLSFGVFLQSQGLLYFYTNLSFTHWLGFTLSYDKIFEEPPRLSMQRCRMVLFKR
jgi:hypothetical protein